MIKTLQKSLLAFALCSGLFVSCGSSESEGEGGGGEVDTLVTIDEKTDPDVFAANEMPDELFGKKVVRADNTDLELPETNLTTMSGEMPGWLEAIISRESIVLFASGILSEAPDETEFAQQEQVQYLTEGDLKGFHVRFNTRPNNYTMVIYGVYTNKDDLKWATWSGAGEQNLILKNLKEGPEVFGTISKIEGEGRQTTVFHTIWEGNEVKMDTRNKE